MSPTTATPSHEDCSFCGLPMPEADRWPHNLQGGMGRAHKTCLDAACSAPVRAPAPPAPRVEPVADPVAFSQLCEQHAECELIPGPFCPYCVMLREFGKGQEYALTLYRASKRATPPAPSSPAVSVEEVARVIEEETILLVGDEGGSEFLRAAKAVLALLAERGAK